MRATSDRRKVTVVSGALGADPWNISVQKSAVPGLGQIYILQLRMEEICVLA